MVPSLCGKNKKKTQKRMTKRRGGRKSRQRVGISRKSKRDGDDDGGEGDLQCLKERERERASEKAAKARAVGGGQKQLA